MPRASHREAGLTLLEVVLMMVLMAILLLVLSEVMGTVSAIQGRVHSQDLASTVSREVMEEIRACGLASRNIFIDDAQGQGFLAALETTAFPILTGSRLPLGDPSSPLVPDEAGETLTGNALLFAIQEPPVLIATTGGSYRVDHVRFVAFYLTKRSEKSVARRGDRIDLVRFTSGAYPERPSIQAITDSGD
ncbi:MAG: type IV pilus modification PilV family protein, partial [Planctomycetota bacterium]